MNNFNFIGRLTADPEQRGTDTPVTTPTIAVDRATKEKGTDFIRLTIFGKQAENLCRFKKKGDLIAVSGYVQTGSYEGKNGKVYTTDFICNRVEFLGGTWKKEQKTEEPGFTATDEDIPF